MQSNGGEILVGADVSKAWIDVCQSGTPRADRIANTPEALAAWIARARPALVGMEPTGGYTRARSVRRLPKPAFAPSSCTPTRSWLFAKAQGLTRQDRP